MSRLFLAFLVTLVMALASACAGNPRVAAAPETPEVDLSGVLRLAARNHRRASACPFTSTLALTNAHVVLTSREFGLEGSYDDAPFFFVWATRGDAATGETTGHVKLDRYRDLAVIESTTPFPKWYPLAKEAPQPGERLSFIGYDWRDRDRAFAERVWTVRLLRISVGVLIYDKAGAPGSSGSCVLNESGEVVGIQAIGAEMETGESVGGAVAVFGFDPEHAQ